MDEKLTHIYEKKWRRINPYICAKCGKPRYSFIFTRAKEKICRSCARNIVPDNQPSLFVSQELISDDVSKSAQKIMEKEVIKQGKKLAKKIDKQALGRGDYETKEIIDIAFPPLKKKKK